MSQALDILPHCEHIVAFYVSCVCMCERKEEDKRKSKFLMSLKGSSFFMKKKKKNWEVWMYEENG